MHILHSILAAAMGTLVALLVYCILSPRLNINRGAILYHTIQYNTIHYIQRCDEGGGGAVGAGGSAAGPAGGVGHEGAAGV